MMDDLSVFRLYSEAFHPKSMEPWDAGSGLSGAGIWRVQSAAGELCLLLQVETRKAMGNLDAIAAVEGVDGVFIGPNDLSADMGYLGNWQHPEVWKVMEEAARRIRKAGKAPGILVGEADGQRCLDMGYLFVAVGADTGTLVRGADTLAAKFKNA